MDSYRTKLSNVDPRRTKLSNMRSYVGKSKIEMSLNMAKYFPNRNNTALTLSTDHEPVSTHTELGTYCTGAQFNQKYKGKIFVKLTNKEECHNGFQFNTGLNTDTVEFTPYGNCLPGGIYFCEFDKIYQWIEYNYNLMSNMRAVTIPDDAQVYETAHDIKADKLILGSALDIWDDYDMCYLIICQNPNLIVHVSKEMKTAELMDCYNNKMEELTC